MTLTIPTTAGLCKRSSTDGRLTLRWRLARELRNAALTALGILLALVVVAVASRGDTPSNQVGDRGAGDALLDILFAFYLFGILLGAVLFVYMLLLRRKFLHQGNAGRRSLLQTLIGMTVFFGVRVCCWPAGWRTATRSSRRSRRSCSCPADTLPQVTTTSIEPAAETDFAWIPVIVTFSLLVLALAGWWWRERRRRRRARRVREPILADAIATAVDESL